MIELEPDIQEFPLINQVLTHKAIVRKSDGIVVNIPENKFEAEDILSGAGGGGLTKIKLPKGKPYTRENKSGVPEQVNHGGNDAIIHKGR
jgi:hypothetical protein